MIKQFVFFFKKKFLEYFTAKFNEWLIKKIGHWGIHTAIKINRMNEEKTNFTQGDTNGNTSCEKNLRL